MSDPFLGMIIIVPYTFAPRGWAFCQGQILSIAANTALFSLLGTTFGGNGQTTFALPDLRGRVPNGAGQGPGLSNYDLGQVSGAESATLTQNQMPLHNHLVNANNEGSTTASPSGAVPGNTAVGQIYASAGDGATTMLPTMLSNAGGGQPLQILQPYLTLNFCIALQGIYPSRN